MEQRTPWYRRKVQMRYRILLPALAIPGFVLSALSDRGSDLAVVLLILAMVVGVIAVMTSTDA